MKFEQLVESAHYNAWEKGFWDTVKEPGTIIALIHSELSEALEAHRKNNIPGVAEELADVLIRVGDMLGGFCIDLGLDEIEICDIGLTVKEPHEMHGKEFGSQICVLHLALSEAYKNHLDGAIHAHDVSLVGFMAGVIFLCAQMDIDIEKAIKKKMKINKKRPRLHGKMY